MGDGEQPLVSSRIRVDGREASLPFALVLAGGLPLTGGVESPELRVRYAQVLQSMAQSFAASVIAEAQQAIQQEGPAEQPGSSAVEQE
jgi:hypothetical protein